MPVCLICVYIYITQLRAPWETTWETCLDIRRWVFNSLVTQELEKSSHMTDIQSNSVHTDATKSVLIKWLHGYGFSCSFMRTVSWDIFSRPWSTRSSSNFIVIKKSPDTRLRIWELARLKYARSSNFQWSQSNLHSNLFFNVFAPSTSNFAEMYNYIQRARYRFMNNLKACRERLWQALDVARQTSLWLYIYIIIYRAYDAGVLKNWKHAPLTYEPLRSSLICNQMRIRCFSI